MSGFVDIPPPLPPRRTPEPTGGKSVATDFVTVPVPSSSDDNANRTDSTTTKGTEQSSAPPPLPPRKALDPPADIHPVPMTATIQVEPKKAPLEPLAVNITPATPLAVSPMTPHTAPGAFSSPGNNAAASSSQPSPPTANVEQTPATAPLPSTLLEAPEKDVPGPRRSSLSEDKDFSADQTAQNVVHEVQHHLTGIPIPLSWTLGAGLLVIVAYTRLMPWWIVLGGVILLGMVHGEFNKTEEEEEDPSVSRLKGDAKAGVQWINHALYALFPLVSTDVLTPFIDLLEDALLQKVPPIVTSVRLDAPALGNQPLLLTSMRPMTDEEWFASVSTPSPDAASTDKSPLVSGASKGHSRALSSESNTISMSKEQPTATRHSRSGSDASVATRASVARTTSRGSVASYIDPAEVKLEAENRRRRDRILSKIRRKQGHHHRSDANHEDPLDPTTPISHPIREGAPQGLHSTVQGKAGSSVDDEMDEDNPLTGQYVNYQVGFEYHRRESTKRKGYGLHVLAYFGVGVKGVGATEFPVYIDMISIKGTLNIRLLLSANPPFARTATISFPRLPVFDISAKPLFRSTFNAMQLPGMKPYVQASIADVARAFVRPNSYTVDVERLLLGREATLRTASIGVLHIIVHSAEGLPKTDTVGTCDPYTSVSFAKYHKPMFSTRTIIDNQNPSWEEPAFLLVTSDEIESGESLRLRICDSDRFSADDAVGQVEVELAELIDRTTGLDEPMRRVDSLQADRPGMKVQGSLTWSVRFAPLWKMPAEELNERMKGIKTARKGECTDPTPWWLEWMARWAGEKPSWAMEREERRNETLAWFTGEKERDELEAMAKPSESLRSGVLQFHIHQCTDLEVESLDGTYSAKSSARKSAAGGKPALSDVIDRTPTENPDPPSAYVEVHLNDRLVYRTRTKQVTPLPYFNAMSERFLRDWRMAKLVFVVRDERDREHDPILGIVSLRLEDLFEERSQLTRWYPLIGGMGWGRIRISLLWKAIDIHLPQRVSGFEIGTLQIKSVSATDLSHLADKKGISVTLETEADRYTLAADESEGVSGASGSPSRARSLSIASPPTTSTASVHQMMLPVDGEAEMEWDLARPIRLAVEYRHSCSVLISFITRTGVMRKKRIVGLASVRLNDVEDWTTISRTVPIFGTTQVKDAIVAGQNYADALAGSVSLSRLPSRDINIIGFVSLEFALRPGVSGAHRRLAKKDLRFKRVYQAWELEREVRRGLSEMSAKDALKADARAKLHRDGGDDDDEDEDEDGDGESGSDSDDDQKSRVERTLSGRTARLSEDEDDDVGMSERRAHAHALHKRNKGIFQLKIARTGRFVKDQIEAKLYSRTKDRRMRGADLDVEQEGQSKL